MKKYKYIVFSNAAGDKDDAFNAWYDDIHLPEVLAVPGFTGAERYRNPALDGAPPEHKYLAIYDIETDTIGATLDELMRRAGNGEMRMSDTLDMETVSTVLYEVITPHRRAK